MGDKSSFQVKMEPLTHKRLKTRASQLNLTIGETVESLLSAFEYRLTRLMEGVKTDCSTDMVDVETQLMRLILKLDAGQIDEKAMKKEIKAISNNIKKDVWEPRIHLKGGDDNGK